MNLHAKFDSLHNRLLRELPTLVLAELESRFEHVSFPAGTVLYDVNDAVERMYFPTKGVASLQIVMKDGCGIDTAIVGCNGALGMADHHRAKARCLVRCALAALSISTGAFKYAASRHPELTKLVIRYSEDLLFQTQVSAARYALLPIEARLAACLLDVAHLFPGSEIELTQEALGEMLAVRRTSVTEAAGKLQHDKIIRYTRGVITILKQSELSRLARVSE
jgi:CRP-like cAMP-binding protein